MAKFDDLSGKTFDFLYVVKRIDDHVMPNGKRKTQFWCRCKCGKELKVLRQNLISRHTRSCGCLPKPKRPPAIKQNRPPVVKQKREGCFYDSQKLSCEAWKCEACGWNPSNTALRETRIEKLKERMALNARNESNTAAENI